MSGIKFTTGTVSAVDEKTVRVRVRLPELDNLRTAWLEVLQRNTQNNKDYWLPDIGEQVKLLLDPYGDDGVVLGAVYSQVDRPAIASRDKRRVDFADGTFVEYDRKTHTMAVGGTLQTLILTTQDTVHIQTQNATVKASQQLILDSPDTLTTGNLTVQKQLTYLGGMSGSGGRGAAVTVRQSPLTAISRPAGISRLGTCRWRTISTVMVMRAGQPASRYKRLQGGGCLSVPK